MEAASGTAWGDSKLLYFLGRMEADESPVQQQIVDDFQRPGDEEGQVDERRPCKQESGEDRSNGGAGGACHSGYARGGGSLFRANDGHGVRLPGWHIHL